MELIFEFLNRMVNIYLLLPFFNVNYAKIQINLIQILDLK